MLNRSFLSPSSAIPDSSAALMRWLRMRRWASSSLSSSALSRSALNSYGNESHNGIHSYTYVIEWAGLLHAEGEVDNERQCLSRGSSELGRVLHGRQMSHGRPGELQRLLHLH